MEQRQEVAAVPLKGLFAESPTFVKQVLYVHVD